MYSKIVLKIIKLTKDQHTFEMAQHFCYACNFAVYQNLNICQGIENIKFDKVKKYNHTSVLLHPALLMDTVRILCSKERECTSGNCKAGSQSYTKYKTIVKIS